MAIIMARHKPPGSWRLADMDGAQKSDFQEKSGEPRHRSFDHDVADMLRYSETF